MEPLPGKTQAAAAWYGARGFPVFPLHSITNGRCSCGKAGCGSPGKHPRTPHGFKDATTDEGRIAEWWQGWPEANIGIPTGSPSGLLVVDVDPRNGGDRSLEELIAQYGPFPETPEQTTGSGGRHIVFRNPSIAVPSTVAAGIDVKGNGGYFVVAPSRTSGTYEWHGTAGARALLSPAHLPTWLLNRMAVARNGMAAKIQQSEEKWGEGERNNRLTSLAGAMRRCGLGPEAIEAALLGENRSHCDPPLSEGEVRRIAQGMARYEPAPENGRREWDFAAVTWPAELRSEAYHGVAGELVRAIEPHSEADPAAILVQFLVAFGNLIGRSAHFLAEADHHFMNLFTVLVGQTAKGRKGTSFGQVQRVLETLDGHGAMTASRAGLPVVKA